MSYICVDRGREKCPCLLMEAGQCYTCGMIKTGKCDCPAGWQGVCPYTEYIQNGKKIKELRRRQWFPVAEKKSFSKELKLAVLQVSAGFALKCKTMGTFLMVEAAGYKIPLSVMKSEIKGNVGNIHLAFYVTGPKTMALEKMWKDGEPWCVTGPFYNGLTNSETFVTDALSVVLAKGVAAMPLINQENRIWGDLAEMFLDKSKLPSEFLKDYMDDIEYESVDLEEDLDDVVEQVLVSREYCLRTTGKKPNVFLMVSPYYVEEILKKACLPREDFIYPNHSNMCCGEGICGACAHTDGAGDTVRGCKCNGMKV